jgi:hypothetical protein
VHGSTLQALLFLPATTPEPWRFDRAMTREISRLVVEVTATHLDRYGQTATAH